MGMDYWLHPPPPVPAEEQVFRRMQSRAAELRHYLAVDHEVARKRAQEELDRLEAAMKALNEVNGPPPDCLDPNKSEDELLGLVDPEE